MKKLAFFAFFLPAPDNADNKANKKPSPRGEGLKKWNNDVMSGFRQKSFDGIAGVQQDIQVQQIVLADDSFALGTTREQRNEVLTDILLDRAFVIEIRCHNSPFPLQ